MSNSGIALTVGGTIAVALIGYLGIRLVNSGWIRNSTASTLWAESTAMRLELRDEVVALRAEVSALRADNEADHARIAELEHELANVRAELETLKGRP